MQHGTLIVLLALLQYVYFIARVGQARGKYNIKAPATDGHEIFDRTFRVQQNTLEQLLIFIPSALAFSFYVSDKWVLIPGAVYLLGRFLYAIAYVKDPSSREIGFGLTLLANAALLFTALAVLLYKMF
jgi:uncharacterized membrane protein YecN with MAPEG domain